MNNTIRQQLKQNHDNIINAMTSQQYFKWHNDFFNGNLDYKSQAVLIWQSTKSLKVRSLCKVAINYYDTLELNKEAI